MSDCVFALHLERHGDELHERLRDVYGQRSEQVYARVVKLLEKAYAERPADLRRLDETRLLRPDWLQDPSQIGYVTYVDRFAETLGSMSEHLDHLESLGVTYLHLMPLLKPRPGANDGGYAVMDYRSVREDLGSWDDLVALTTQLRERGISPVLDLVLNHVACEHEWAERARAGEQKYRDYFYLFPDRTLPDQYEKTLPEIFPEFAPGNFTWDEPAQAWVWTTFNSYQWDVNWGNPDVFCEYLDIICALVNAGVEVIRLDAIAFIWKRLGTICQGQPEVHALTAALRAALRIVAPGAAFKAEAIVGPSELLPYLGRGRYWGKVSDLAYHNSLMVQLWSSLASRDTHLFEAALRAFPTKPSSTTWGTYVRVHDDIGWAISDEDAAAVGLSGSGHRSFLSDFYSGNFPGSFARGLVFQFNPITNDRRISGSCASLAGLESALETGDEHLITDAIGRIVLIHTAILGFGGIPLLYMGDEIGMLSDYGYADDPVHAADNRWAHRPRMDWDAVASANANPHSSAGRILSELRRRIGIRQGLDQLHASVESTVVSSPNSHLLILKREHPTSYMVQIYNVSEHLAALPRDLVWSEVGSDAVDVLTGLRVSESPDMIAPYQALWFVGEEASLAPRY